MSQPNFLLGLEQKLFLSFYLPKNSLSPTSSSDTIGSEILPEALSFPTTVKTQFIPMNLYSNQRSRLKTYNTFIKGTLKIFLSFCMYWKVEEGLQYANADHPVPTSEGRQAGPGGIFREIISLPACWNLIQLVSAPTLQMPWLLKPEIVEACLQNQHSIMASFQK